MAPEQNTATRHSTRTFNLHLTTCNTPREDFRGGGETLTCGGVVRGGCGAQASLPVRQTQVLLHQLLEGLVGFLAVICRGAPSIA